MANPFETMRDQIIGMQKYFAAMSENEKKSPDVAKAIIDLCSARSSLETCMMRLHRQRHG